MGKQAQPRRLSETEAQAVSRVIRTSPRKLNLVAGMIRGKTASKALADLTFSKRRIALEVKKVLESAIANAVNNHQLYVVRLVVSQDFVGKSFTMKRFRARARGRVGRVDKPWSNLTVIVAESEGA
ncbi:MAG: 50S ribosomal protein L22 [Roseitalea porphyridii]